MTTSLRQILIGIGLSVNEAEVYLGALTLGPSSVQQLARASAVKRTTVYSVVESLKDKGLINTEVQRFKKLYVAENPEKLESILDARKKTVRDALPEFLSLYNLKGTAAFIKYYEGMEAMKSVYEGLLADARPGDDYLVISDFGAWYSLDPGYFEDFLRRRARMELRIRVLVTDTPWARSQLPAQERYNWQMRFLPPGTKLSTNVVIIPKKVVVHQIVPPLIALVLENTGVVQYHRELFEMIWCHRT